MRVPSNSFTLNSVPTNQMRDGKYPMDAETWARRHGAIS